MPLSALVNAIGMSFRLVPPGVAHIGSPVTEHKRSPTDLTHRRQILAAPFWIAETPTTQREYAAVTGSYPSYFRSDEDARASDRPVESVSWRHATQFCVLLSNLHKERMAGRSYRLPSEVEWEYACRAGTVTAFNVGDDLTPASANFDGTFPYIDGPPGAYLASTTPVRAYHANKFGLFDLHGNVWELCLDSYRRDALPLGSGAPRVLRGGSWHSYGRFCRSAAREATETDAGYFDQGFRVVCVTRQRS
jgi:formylglycine-generating enzyme required for sulfatase activity